MCLSVFITWKLYCQSWALISDCWCVICQPSAGSIAPAASFSGVTAVSRLWPTRCSVVTVSFCNLPLSHTILCLPSPQSPAGPIVTFVLWNSAGVRKFSLFFFTFVHVWDPSCQIYRTLKHFKSDHLLLTCQIQPQPMPFHRTNIL